MDDGRLISVSRREGNTRLSDQRPPVGTCAIAIMAKTPQPGRSKTRLCPPLRAEEAAALSAAFLRDMTTTIRIAAHEAAIDAYVAFCPAGSEAGLADHLAPGTRLLLADGAGIDDPGVVGFGRPLLQTIRTLLARGYTSACVLNSDSPTLPAALLVEAATLLAGAADAVLGPATDGGYYLLGLRAAHPLLFADIAWSTAAVADQTRAQAHRAGLAMAELAPWYDVDDAASLRRLTADLDRYGPRTAPATAARLAALGLDATGLATRLEQIA
jgi:rSAM/selenodomain-associated transferase 1